MSFYIIILNNVIADFFNIVGHMIGPFYSKETARIILMEFLVIKYKIHGQKVVSLLNTINESLLPNRRPDYEDLIMKT